MFQKHSLRVLRQVIFMALAFPSFGLMAQNTMTFTGSGNWSDAALWSGNTLPGPTDNVVISNGSFCLADGNYTCNRLTLQGGTNGGNTTFKIDGTYTFQVTDQLTITSSVGIDSTFQIVDVGDGTLDLSRCHLNSGNSLRTCEVVIRGGALNVYELLYANGNARRNSIRFIGSGNLNIYGVWQSGFIVPGDGTVNYLGGDGQVIFSAGNIDYPHLYIGGEGRKSLLAGTRINGELRIGSGTLDPGRFGLTVRGETLIETGTSYEDSDAGGTNTFVGKLTNLGTLRMQGSPVVMRGGFVNEGSFVSGTGIYTFNTNPQIVITDELSFEGNVVVNSEVVFQVGELGIAGSLSGTGDIVLLGEQFTIGGGFTNTGAFDVGTSTVHYNGQNGQTVKSSIYNNLIVSGTGNKNIGAVANPTIVRNNLVVLGGNFNFNARNVTIKGETHVEEGATIMDSSNSGINIFEGKVINKGDWVPFGSAFEFQNGILNLGRFEPTGTYDFRFTTNPQALEGNAMFFNWDVVVNTELEIKIPELTTGRSISGSGKIILHDNILNIGLNFSNTGEFEPGNSTVNFFRNGGQNVKSTTYYNLHINGSGIKTLGVTSGPAIVTNELVVAGGSLNLWTRDARIEGTTLILSEGILMDSNTTGTNIFEGLVTNFGAWQNTALSPFTFQGGFVNHGEFISTGGPTTFDTNPQVIEGNAMDFRGGVAVNSELDIRVPELTVPGHLSGTGKIILHDNILNLGNGFTNTGEFVAGTSMVNYYRASTQTIRPVPYYQLKISGSNRKSLSGPTTVQKAVIVKGGSVHLAGHTLSIIKNNVL